MALTKQNFGNQIDETLAQSMTVNPSSESNASPATPAPKKSRSQAKTAHFDTDEAITANNFDDADVNDDCDNDSEDYHVRAGRIGGQTTKQRHRDSNFYREIGARGGASTMARHAQEYEERRKKGGETTRERYGEEYYHNIAEKAARVKQDATRLRNEAIKALLGDGWKIPTIIKLTLRDMQAEPRLQKHLADGPVAEYLQTRPDLTEVDVVFVSQSGKPLSLANTYTIMERHRP